MLNLPEQGGEMKLPAKGFCILCHEDILTTGCVVTRYRDPDDGDPCFIIAADGVTHHVVFGSSINYWKDQIEIQRQERMTMNRKVARKRTKHQQKVLQQEQFKQLGQVPEGATNE